MLTAVDTTPPLRAATTCSAVWTPARSWASAVLAPAFVWLYQKIAPAPFLLSALMMLAMLVYTYQNPQLKNMAATVAQHHRQHYDALFAFLNGCQ